MKYRTTVLTLGLITWAGLALAQPGGNLGQLEVNVTDKYKARVGEAVKVSEFPSFKDTTTRKLPVQYTITSQPIRVTFNPEPLQPARIAKIPVDELPKGLIRAGYGLYNTALAEFYYNSGRSSKYSYGFSGRHFSTQDGVDDIIYEDNGMSRNALQGYFNRFYRDLKWETDVYARFRKVSYYGNYFAEESPFIQAEPPKLDENWYRQFGLHTAVVSPNDKAMGWTRSLGIDYYHLSDNYNSQENNFRLNTAYSIPAEDKTLELEANLQYLQTTYDSLSDFDQSYFTVQLRPYITTTLKDMRFHFGLNLYYNQLSTSLDAEADGDIYFFPEVRVSYPVVQDVLTTYAGIEGHLQHNTVQSLIATNPFISPGQFLTPSRSTDIFIGMNGILSATTSFNVRGGFKDVNDLALFYRRPDFNLVEPGISVLYDDADIFYINGELSVNLKDNLQILVGGQLQTYNMKNFEEAWHLPVFTANLGTAYTLKEKIRFTADLQYVGPRTAFNQDLNQAIDSELNAFIQANLGIEYLYNSRLSAFIKTFNLFNSSYDYYLGYSAQNINVLFGIGYQF